MLIWSGSDSNCLDTSRQGLPDPFREFPWLNLRSEASSVLNEVGEMPERIDIRSELGLTESLHRHDALDDARDVKLLLDALNQVYMNSVL